MNLFKLLKNVRARRNFRNIFIAVREFSSEVSSTSVEFIWVISMMPTPPSPLRSTLQPLQTQTLGIFKPIKNCIDKDSALTWPDSWFNAEHTIYSVVKFSVVFPLPSNCKKQKRRFLWHCAKKVIHLNFMLFCLFIPASASAFVHYNSNIQTSRAAGRTDTARIYAETRSKPVLAGDRGCGEANWAGYQTPTEN